MSLVDFQEGLQSYLVHDYEKSLKSFEMVKLSFKKRFKLIFRKEKVLDFLIASIITSLALVWIKFIKSFNINQDYLKRNHLIECLGIIDANEYKLEILRDFIEDQKLNKAREIGIKAIDTNVKILERKIHRSLSNLHSRGIE